MLNKQFEELVIIMAGFFCIYSKEKIDDDQNSYKKHGNGHHSIDDDQNSWKKTWKWSS
ncbi:hypothetical protein [Bacillus sp. OK048]|uniref:hypothetical protein n=1 Tax=Bacillus sp. OK048 TaxID=1882761 RepID=UPI001C31C07E|nr:hypothetical protein [Bacillus sp. OK048]